MQYFGGTEASTDGKTIGVGNKICGKKNERKGGMGAVFLRLVLSLENY